VTSNKVKTIIFGGKVLGCMREVLVGIAKIFTRSFRNFKLPLQSK
jgi:hypothetical protein